MTWTPSVAPQPLDDAHVHVWRVRLDTFEDPDSECLILSPDEIDRAGRYSNPLARRNFIFTRATLRRVLGSYLQIPPDELEFVGGRYGKAAVSPSQSRSLEFNLSHSGAYALLVVGRAFAVGVDIEKHNPRIDLDTVAETAFSERELLAWRRLSPEARLQAFFDTWVRKEAFIKAIGRGLGFGLQRFDVTVGSPAAVERIDGDELAALGWGLRTLEPDSGYSAAVAAEISKFFVLPFEFKESLSHNLVKNR